MINRVKANRFTTALKIGNMARKNCDSNNLKLQIDTDCKASDVDKSVTGPGDIIFISKL